MLSNLCSSGLEGRGIGISERKLRTMKRREKIFAIAVVVFTCLLAVYAAFTLIMLCYFTHCGTIPVVLLLGWAIPSIAGLITTSVLNFRMKTLNVTSTSVQCFFLLFSLYGFPLFVWAVILLVKAHKETNRLPAPQQDTSTT